jgi:hypothetical protein
VEWSAHNYQFRFNYCRKKYVIFLTKKASFHSNISSKRVGHRHASVSGSASGKVKRSGETAGTKSERNDRRRAADGSNRSCGK